MVLKGQRTAKEKNRGAEVKAFGAGVFPLFIPNIRITVFKIFLFGRFFFMPEATIATG